MRRVESSRSLREAFRSWRKDFENAICFFFFSFLLHLLQQTHVGRWQQRAPSDEAAGIHQQLKAAEAEGAEGEAFEQIAAAGVSGSPWNSSCKKEKKTKLHFINCTSKLRNKQKPSLQQVPRRRGKPAGCRVARHYHRGTWAIWRLPAGAPALQRAHKCKNKRIHKMI